MFSFGFGDMPVLLVFGLFVVIATAHNITFLEVPQYGDPLQEASLVCHYVSEQDDPPLHSVKWYRGTNEIFRFTPGTQPTTRTFNSSAGGVSRSTCNANSCAISLVLPLAYNSRLSFTCEVSTEGPRFAVVKQTKNLTVAVTLKEDPLILGAPATVPMGEEVLLNCTTQPSMPPANIVWYIDGVPEKMEPWMMNNTQVSPANEFGLRSSWRSLRLRVATANDHVILRCEATQPTWPPYIRNATATITIVKSPNLSMFTAAGSSPRLSAASVVSLWSAAVHILSKHSALGKV